MVWGTWNYFCPAPIQGVIFPSVTAARFIIPNSYWDFALGTGWIPISLMCKHCGCIKCEVWTHLADWDKSFLCDGLTEMVLQRVNQLTNYYGQESHCHRQWERRVAFICLNRQILDIWRVWHRLYSSELLYLLTLCPVSASLATWTSCCVIQSIILCIEFCLLWKLHGEHYPLLSYMENANNEIKCSGFFLH